METLLANPAFRTYAFCTAILAFKMLYSAVYTGTPIMTTISGAKAAALGIAALKKNGYAVKTVQEYH